MASTIDQTEAKKLTQILLVGGKLYAGYQSNGKKYEGQICNVWSEEPFVIITTNEAGTRKPFYYSHLIKEENFYVVEKIEEKNGQVYGKQRTIGKEPEVWLPILPNNEDDQVLYVKYPDGRLKLVVLEDSRPFTTLEKAAVCAAVAAGAVSGAGLTLAAAPVAVAGAGFGAGGIVAGSTAATMMSMGISVATLQSIGAAGLGAASTIIIGGVGAMAGTAASIAAALTKKPTYKVDGKGIMSLFLMKDARDISLPPVADILGLDVTPQQVPASSGSACKL